MLVSICVTVSVAKRSAGASMRLLLDEFTEHCAQDVGAAGNLARAEAVADALDLSRGIGPNVSPNSAAMAAPVGVMNSNGSSIWPMGMPWRISSVAGAGMGKRPCAQSIQPWPSASALTKIFSTPQFLQADAGQRDVRDGVQRADLVETDGFDGGAVDFGLGDGDAMENAQRVPLDEI